MNYTHLILGILALYVGNIACNQQNNWFYADDGSADDGDDDNWGRPYDEESEEGSGSGDGAIVNVKPLTDCQNLRRKMLDKQQNGQRLPYIPLCTWNGEYEPQQCDPAGRCWCVTYSGREIDKSVFYSPQDSKCNQIDRSDDDRFDIEEPIHKVDNPNVGGGRTGPEETIPIDGDDTDDNTDDRQSNEQGGNKVLIYESEPTHRAALLTQPLILAGIIAFAVVCLLCAVLLVMFIVYRMRKKDEGSYALDEPKRAHSQPYQRAPTKELYA